MLKGVPQILPPELLKILSEMGHTDRIVISDSNFPAASMSRNGQVIRLDASGVPEVLDAVLRLMPLDKHIERPVTLMRVDKGTGVTTPIWDTYRAIVGMYDVRGAGAFEAIDRPRFYEWTKEAYAIVYTGEKALYAPIILQKGVLDPSDFVPIYGKE